MSVMKPFPWEEAIGLGLGILKLSPHDLWAMTPRELAFAIRALTGATAPLMRSDLRDLMKRFPDG